MENIKVLRRNLCFTWQAAKAAGEEYFELNKEDLGAALSIKDQDHVDRKKNSSPGSKRCLVQTIKSYLSYLNPEVELLFRRPKAESTKSKPEEASVWIERKVLGHSMLEND